MIDNPISEPIAAFDGWGIEISLTELREGESAVVARLDECSTRIGEQLTARGLAPGMAITLLRSGDPLLVAAGPSRWGITRHEASRIGVARLDLVLGGSR